MELATFVRDLGRETPGVPGAENRLVVSRLDSTNRLARSIVSVYDQDEMEPPGLVILSLAQTAGRGRQGRTWVSPPSAGVYATRVLPVATGRSLGTIPLLAAIGLARALNELLGPLPGGGRCRLKWPNDLMVDGRKVGGVLVESIARSGAGSTALVGFGVNYGPQPGVRGATTLADVARGDLPPLGRVAGMLVEGLEAALERVGDATHAIESFRALTVHRPGDTLRFKVGEELVGGELIAFDEQGFVRLRQQDGTERRISSGEIVEEFP